MLMNLSDWDTIKTLSKFILHKSHNFFIKHCEGHGYQPGSFVFMPTIIHSRDDAHRVGTVPVPFQVPLPYCETGGEGLQRVKQMRVSSRMCYGHFPPLLGGGSAIMQTRWSHFVGEATIFCFVGCPCYLQLCRSKRVITTFEARDLNGIRKNCVHCTNISLHLLN